MSEQFQKGVEGLYAAFEGYPKPDNVAGSPVYGNLEEWQEAERRAIHSYLDGLWDLMLSDSKTGEGMARKAASSN